MVMVLACDLFFFSSRRRHTRCSRDWSSDVCSSDLPGRPAIGSWFPVLLATTTPEARQALRGTPRAPCQPGFSPFGQPRRQETPKILAVPTQQTLRIQDTRPLLVLVRRPRRPRPPRPLRGVKGELRPP